MKKLFISLVAIAAAVFATSCTNDIEGGIKFNGKTATVGFEVSTPELATRTFGDGQSATNLYYGVYDDKGVLLPEISVIHGQNTPEVINIKTTVNFELVTGDSYTIVFWAENAGSAATINWDNAEMTFNPALANQENYDAFWAAIPVVVEGPATIKADLFRPFAQVNIGTADFEKARKAGMEVEEVKLTVKSAKTLNLFDGTVVDEKTYTYNYAELPTEAYPVAGYEYITMNYVLVAKEKHLVDVTMDYLSTENRNYQVVYGNVPVQRNYRTNIYGNLLTDQTGVIVEIKPAFEGVYGGEWDGTNSYRVSTAAEFQEVLDTATTDVTIFFDADIVGDVTVLQKENVDIRVEGEGKKYDGTILVNGNARAAGAETLTFKNINFESTTEKTFISAPSKVDGRYNYSHNITIDGCNFTGNYPPTEIGAISLTGCYNVVVKNCVATAMHSLLQVQSCDNTVVVENVKVVACKNGISFGNTAFPILRGSEIEADFYGVRADGNANRGKLVVENTEIEAEKPVVVRKVTTAGYAVELGEGVELTTAAEYHVIFTSGSDDAAPVKPTVEYFYTSVNPFNVFPSIVTNVEALKEALKDNSTEVILAAGATFDITGETIYITTAKTIKSFDPANKATIKGKLVADMADVTFENVKFAPNAQTSVDLAKGVYGTYVVGSYNAIVTVNRCGATFNGCEFDGGDDYMRAINYFQEAAGKILTVENCAFNQTYIYSKVLCNINNNTFTLNECPYAVCVWPCVEGSTNNSCAFTNNDVTSNFSAGKANCELMLLSQTAPYANVEFNVQGNTGAFVSAYARVNAVRCATDGSVTFAAGSKTFTVKADGTI